MERPKSFDRAPMSIKNYITLLEANIRSLQTRLAEHEAPVTDDTVVRLYNYGITPDAALPPNSIVRFKMGAGQYDTVDVSLDGRNALVIRGQGCITLRPEAANTIIITTERL